jgi:hypothetical protein
MNTRAAFVFTAALLLGGCNVEWRREHPLTCRLDEQRLVRDTLYFGASMAGGGEVDETAWHQFEHDVLTPAFASGFSVLDARGAWRGSNGQTHGERSRIVVIVHADTEQIARAVRDVAARYRERFHQESVLHEYGVVCAQF